MLIEIWHHGWILVDLLKYIVKIGKFNLYYNISGG